MRHEIPTANWTSALVEAIEAASAGDVIVVVDWYAAQLGHGAAERLRGGGHGLLFEAEGVIVEQSDADGPEGTDE